MSLRHPSAWPKMIHPDTQQPWHHGHLTSLPQCQHVDNQRIDQSAYSSSLPCLTPSDKAEALFSTGMKITPKSLPCRLPPPQPNRLTQLSTHTIRGTLSSKSSQTVLTFCGCGDWCCSVWLFLFLLWDDYLCAHRCSIRVNHQKITENTGELFIQVFSSTSAHDWVSVHDVLKFQFWNDPCY